MPGVNFPDVDQNCVKIDSHDQRQFTKRRFVIISQ